MQRNKSVCKILKRLVISFDCCRKREFQYWDPCKLSFVLLNEHHLWPCSNGSSDSWFHDRKFRNRSEITRLCCVFFFGGDKSCMIPTTKGVKNGENMSSIYHLLLRILVSLSSHISYSSGCGTESLRQRIKGTVPHLFRLGSEDHESVTWELIVNAHTLWSIMLHLHTPNRGHPKQ